MILFTGQRPSVKWILQLEQMSACWRRGEKTAMLARDYVMFEYKYEHIAEEWSRNASL